MDTYDSVETTRDTLYDLIFFSQSYIIENMTINWHTDEYRHNIKYYTLSLTAIQ